MIKKTKRLHQLYQDWLKIRKMDGITNHPFRHKHSIFAQPMAGKWYYTYSNDKGMAVGLAKLQNHLAPFGKGKWMWEICTANEKLELRRFPTQKAAEKVIYQFLK